MASLLGARIGDYIWDEAMKKKLRKHSLLWERERIDGDVIEKMAQIAVARFRKRCGGYDEKMERIAKKLALIQFADRGHFVDEITGHQLPRIESGLTKQSTITTRTLCACG
jgi:hypothetical protein